MHNWRPPIPYAPKSAPLQVVISQRKLRPILENAHELTATALFDMVDTDSSNTLEREEFVYMHTMVLNALFVIVVLALIALSLLACEFLIGAGGRFKS